MKLVNTTWRMRMTDTTKVKSYRLTNSEEKALQELAKAGHVMNPDNFKDITESSAVRRAIRDAWASCPQTKDQPFPGE